MHWPFSLCFTFSSQYPACCWQWLPASAWGKEHTAYRYTIYHSDSTLLKKRKFSIP